MIKYERSTRMYEAAAQHIILFYKRWTKLNRCRSSAKLLGDLNWQVYNVWNKMLSAVYPLRHAVMDIVCGYWRGRLMNARHAVHGDRIRNLCVAIRLRWIVQLPTIRFRHFLSTTILDWCFDLVGIKQLSQSLEIFWPFSLSGWLFQNWWLYAWDLCV